MGCPVNAILCSLLIVSFFFFQAEDGIRDRNVTGVQTCALPIFHYWMTAATNPTDADTTNILFTKLNSVFDIGSVKYNGTTFTLVGEQSLTADTTVTTYEGHSIAFKLKPEPSFTEQLGVVEQIKIAVVKPIAKQQLGVVEQIKIAVVKPIA